MGLKVDGDYVKDGSRKVARIKNDCIYKGTSTSSSNLLAYIRKEKFSCHGVKEPFFSQFRLGNWFFVAWVTVVI